MEPDWARQDIAEDIRRAGDLLRAAQSAGQVGAYLRQSAKITASSSAHESELELESRGFAESAIGVLQSRPFFRRISVEFAEGPIEHYCLTEVRSVASICAHVDADCIPIGWTSPVAASLPPHIGAEIRRVPRGSGRIASQARYPAQVLPLPTEGKLEGPQGKYEFVRQLVPVSSPQSSSPPGELSPPYTETPLRLDAPIETAAGKVRATQIGSRAQGGLVNIAAVADYSQWTTFHRDITRSVLVDGPPGSGKTSVALMRIPCLIDRQWEDLRLTPRVDVPRYTEPRTLVIVANPALLSTLKRLMESLQLQRVRAVDIESLLAEQLAGTMLKPIGVRPAVRDELGMMEMREFLPVITRGLHRNTLDVVERAADIGEVKQLPASAIRSLRSALSRWAAMVSSNSRQPFSTTIVNWIKDESSAQGERRFPGIAEAARAVTQQIFNRQALIRKGVSVTTSEVSGAKVRRVEAWKAAFERSPIDASLGEWCALAALRAIWYSNSNTKSLPGYLRVSDPPTHIVVDEAQDLGPAAFEFLQSWIPVNGVFTLAGDPQQSARTSTPRGGWCGLPTESFDRVYLDVNYRQSREIGAFVRTLYRELFDREPQWRAGARLAGIRVRLREMAFPTVASVSVAVVDEARRLRNELPGDSIAIIHQGDSSLTETLVVELTKQGDCEVRQAASIAHDGLAPMVVGTAWELRGLEFGAVLVLDRACSQVPDLQVSEQERHALYVAASRACNGLAVVCSGQASGSMFLAAGREMGLA